MTKNLVLLERLKVHLPDAGQNNIQLAMSANNQLMEYGYILTQPAFNMLVKADSADIISFYEEVCKFLKEMMGGGSNFRTLYGNFPNDVMSMSHYELFWNQVSHYWGQKTFPPKGAEKLPEVFEKTQFKEIDACTEQDFLNVFKSLLSVNQSVTPRDQRTIVWFVENGLDINYPDTIPFKENLAIIARLCPNFKVKTVVDVLRVAVAFSGGDVSLPAVPKPLKFKNYYADKRNSEILKQRKAFQFKLNEEQVKRILDLFENSNLSLSDFNQGRRYSRFIRLFEHLQIANRKLQYPKTEQAIYLVRNQVRKGKPDGVSKIRTWYSQVEAAFKKGFEEGVIKLSERPGEFLRKLDYLVRNNQSNSVNLGYVLAHLSKVAEGSSNKVIFETYTHFENRSTPVTNRSVFVKGARSKTQLPNLPAINKFAVEAIQETLLTAFQNKLRDLSPMGKCWIDPELKKIPLPTNMRSTSDSLVTTVRGTRIPVQIQKSTLRAFVHWNDPIGSMDVDLHGYLIGPDKSTQFGFNGNQTTNYGCYSGDVRRVRGNCAEYVDIDIKKAMKEGFDIYLMVVHDFQQKGFSNVPDCYAGLSFTDHPHAGRNWKPSNIVQSFALKAPSNYCLAFAFDFNTNEMITLDLDWDTIKRTCNVNDTKDLRKTIGGFICDPKISVYDLLNWHVQARGQLSSPELAETNFMYQDFVSSYVKTLEFMGV
jgi:hypothetical protein